MTSSDSKPCTVLVVGVDFSEMSEHLLHTAKGLARVAGKAEIHVVHVLPPMKITPVGWVAANATIENAILRARTMLSALCETALADSDAKVLHHVAFGDAAEELERVAVEVNADVIVVEAHGRTGIQRMLHRSVAAKLSRDAPCSVLTVRPKAPPQEAEVELPPPPRTP
jgi:nucleotide-binding universal stress UspA family protein